MTYQDQQAQAGALDWDAEISDDFFTLAPGIYEFEVTDFEKAWFDGSEKIPACNEAIVTLRISTSEGEAYIKERLKLVTKLQFILSQFFTSIGHKKNGEKLRMDWSKVRGAKGIVKIINHEYNGNIYNRVDKFLPPGTPFAQPSQAAEQVDEPMGWKGGVY